MKEYLLAPYSTYSTIQILLEILGATFGLLSVFFSIKKNIWVYPIGIVSTSIYIYILFTAHLWGDMLINVYYTIMSIYGWLSWQKHTNDKIHISVSYCHTSDWLFSAVLFILSSVLVATIYYFQPLFMNGFSSNGITLGWSHLTKANYLDIATTAIFLVGMWLMAKRKIENWLFWIVGDIICIPMMLYKNLAITAIQFFIFSILAIIGLYQWRKSFSSDLKKTI